jgi:DNA-directed RNA polymerase subunit RPC12/RpoP
MGILRSIKCSTCGFTLLTGTGVAPYVKKPKGFLRRLFGLGENKVFLQDPPAGNLSKNFPNKELSELIQEKQVGHYAAYLCLSCLKIFELDSSSEKKCKHCKRTSVKSVFEMVGEKCPKCGDGIIEDKRIGIT